MVPLIVATDGVPLLKLIVAPGAVDDAEMVSGPSAVVTVDGDKVKVSTCVAAVMAAEAVTALSA